MIDDETLVDALLSYDEAVGEDDSVGVDARYDTEMRDALKKEILDRLAFLRSERDAALVREFEAHEALKTIAAAAGLTYDIHAPAGSGAAVEPRRVRAEPDIGLHAVEAGFQGRPEPLSESLDEAYVEEVARSLYGIATVSAINVIQTASGVRMDEHDDYPDRMWAAADAEKKAEFRDAARRILEKRP